VVLDKDRPLQRKRIAMRRWTHPLVRLLMCSGWILLLGGLVYLGAMCWMLRPIFPEGDTPRDQFVFEGEALEGYAVSWVNEDDVLIPVELLRDVLGFAVHIDWRDGEGTPRVIWTAPTTMLKMHVGDAIAHLNEAPIELRVPVRVIDDMVYIPGVFIESATDLVLDVYQDTGCVHILRRGTAHMLGTVVDDVYIPGSPDQAIRSVAARIWPHQRTVLRSHPDTQAPVLLELVRGDEVYLLGMDAGWYQVIARGIVGFVPYSAITGHTITTIDHTRAHDPRERIPKITNWSSWRPERPLSGERITMVWEHVRGGGPDTSEIAPMQGLNVVSPTWFALDSEGGRFASSADPRYVAWAQGQGLRVWGLATNSFDPDLTSAALRDPDARNEMVRQLIGYASMYRLDGINIDFENVYYEDRDLLTQFMRELTVAARRHDLTISIDVTVISSSRNWSMCYDRAALGEIVDYVIVMAYDEHWATSPRSGSVASLPWVEAGLRGVLAEVPHDRLILGIPFYTRIWKEREEDGKTHVSSRAVGMATQAEIRAEHAHVVTWDEHAGQYYLEYEENDHLFRIWMEDETSLRARLALVQKYNLAGVAAWRRGLEKPEFWPIIADAMRTWP